MLALNCGDDIFPVMQARAARSASCFSLDLCSNAIGWNTVAAMLGVKAFSSHTPVSVYNLVARGLDSPVSPAANPATESWMRTELLNILGGDVYLYMDARESYKLSLFF
jgi:hypothetical protein